MAQYDTIWYTRCPVPTATGIAADLGWGAELDLRAMVADAWTFAQLTAQVGGSAR